MKKLTFIMIMCLYTATPFLQAEEMDDESLHFLEIPSVLTASRRVQSIMKSPVAIDVITQEDIEASGAVNLWDLLRYRVGMEISDQRSADTSRAIVSVRGFPAEFVGSLQVLIDGRTSYSASQSGVNWATIPVQIQDIEKIEIVRGPNGALYGSNSGLGVINIITKKPKNKAAASMTGIIGNRNLNKVKGFVESAGDITGFRLSYDYQKNDGFPKLSGGVLNDHVLDNRANLRGFLKPAEKTGIEIFAGGYWGSSQHSLDTGDRHSRLQNHFQMFKLQQDINDASSVEIITSRKEDIQITEPIQSGAHLRETQYDSEILHRFRWLDERMQTVWGGSSRYARVSSDQEFAGDPVKLNRIYRGFFSQSIEVSPLLSLSGAYSLEDSNTGGTESSYQAAALLSPSENHAFRASYSKSNTIPGIVQQNANFQVSPLVRLEGNPDIKSVQIINYELGYQGNYLMNKLRVENNYFYMILRNQELTIIKSFVLFPVPAITLSRSNIDNSIARGTEVKLRYQLSKNHSVYTNYTYEIITDEIGSRSITKTTPEHKVNVGFRTYLGRGFTASANAGYKDVHEIFSDSRRSTTRIPDYIRLDAKLVYVPIQNVEVFVAGQNLGRTEHLEGSDGLIIRRTYQGGVTVKFGA